MANQIIQLTDSSSNVLSPKVGHLEAVGIYNVDHPNWDNSNTLYLLSSKFNGSIYKVVGTAGTEGTNYPPGLPAILQNTTTVLMRSQFASRVNSSSTLHGVVVLYEVYPMPGRIWVSVYNVSWSSWMSLVAGTGHAWRYTGEIINSESGTVKGYGTANIQLLANGLYRIDFTAKIDTAGTVSNDYSTGVPTSLFTSTVGKTITPISTPEGLAYWFNSSGVLRTDRTGYGLRTGATAGGTRWAIGRKYAASGSDFGTWADSAYTAGDIIYGTCYGA